MQIGVNRHNLQSCQQRSGNVLTATEVINLRRRCGANWRGKQSRDASSSSPDIRKKGKNEALFVVNYRHKI